MAKRKISHDYFSKVVDYFNGDIKQAWRWFETINPALGLLSPKDLIADNKGARVEVLINKAIKGEARL